MSNPFAAPNPPPEDPDGRVAGPPQNAPYGAPPSAPGYGNPYPSPEPPSYGTPPPPGAPNPYGAPAGYGTQSTFGPPPGYDHGYQPVPSTNGKAIASLVLGILGLLCFAVLTAVPAIILGHSARREIRAGKGTGDGLALAGIVIGWIITGFTILALLGFLAIFIFVPEQLNTAP